LRSSKCRPTRRGPSWGKKDKHCQPTNPDDQEQGSYWDHVLFDTHSRLIVTLVIGRRTEETVYQAFTDFYQRTDGQLPALFTTDEYAAYDAAIADTYSVPKEALELTEEQKADFGWEEMPPVYFPVEIGYATVQKVRQKGRVVKVKKRVRLGTKNQVDEALAEGSTVATINTSYVERLHGTQRHFNARKARKVYTFSKELLFHVAVTWLYVVYDNFGRTPRTLREKVQEIPPRYQYRTPAMVAGVTDHGWSLENILNYPLFPPLAQPTSPNERHTRKKKSDGR
jgi:IS1 family transposase